MKQSDTKCPYRSVSCDVASALTRLASPTRQKPKATKSRLLLEKVQKRQKDNEKLKRIQKNEIFRLKSLRRKVDEETQQLDAKNKKRADDEEKRLKHAKKRIGRLKYEMGLKLSREFVENAQARGQHSYRSL